MTIHNTWKKNIPYRRKESLNDNVICATCKKKVMASSLKEKIVPQMNGSYKVKGICPVCKGFAKWVSNKQSEFYGKLG